MTLFQMRRNGKNSYLGFIFVDIFPHLFRLYKPLFLAEAHDTRPFTTHPQKRTSRNRHFRYCQLSRACHILPIQPQFLSPLLRLLPTGLPDPNNVKGQI